MWNAKDVTLIYGPVRVDEFGDGDKISIAYRSAMSELVVGTDGDYDYSKMNDRSATVTIRTMHTSPANDQLLAIANLMLETGQGEYPIFIDDANGKRTHEALDAVIENIPNFAYGSSSPQIEWVFLVGHLKTLGRQLPPIGI